MRDTPTKIPHPQIFVIYQSGMFGSFICNLLMHQELLFKPEYQHKKFSTEAGMEYNSHGGPYKDMLKGFHWIDDEVYKMNDQELQKFFSPMESFSLGLHRISDYGILKIKFEDFFDNPLRIIMMPQNKDDLKVWSERMFYATGKNVTLDFWYPQFKKKGVANLPKYLIEGLSIKEKYKFAVANHEKLFDKIKGIPTNKYIFFDPKDIANHEKLQKLMDEICYRFKISKFKIPTTIINQFLDKNEVFLKRLH